MTLVIFDYDDTLFPSTYFQYDQNIPKKYFKKLDNVIYNLIISILNKNYKIIIVSNGSIEWIKYSVVNLPKLKQFLDNNIIRCISTRDTYEQTLIPYEQWKHYGIANILTSSKYCNQKYIIGIGDSDIDYDAIVNACNYTGKKHQFIKFTPEMSINMLIDTIDKFNDYFKQYL